MRLRDPPRRRCVSFFAPRAQCCLNDVLALQEGSTSSMLPAMYARATRDSYANVLIFAQEAARLAGAEAKVAEVQVRQRVAARDGFYLLVLDNVRERRRSSTRRQRCGWMCWLLCVRACEVCCRAVRDAQEVPALAREIVSAKAALAKKARLPAHRMCV